MSRPILLIAEREFRTYVATLSFWLSLAVMPLAGGLLLAFSGGHAHQTYISVLGSDARMVRAAERALVEAGQVDDRSLAMGPGRDTLKVFRSAPGAIELSYSENFPLSPLGRTLVARTMERDAAREQSSMNLLTVRQVATDAAADVDGLARLAATMMLWLTLVGSLGMLLQAVVRERANRALESLLAAVRAWQIVAGKMLGVGMVSLLILGCWLGSAFSYSFLLPPDAGFMPGVLAKLAQPLALLRAAAIYICAFAFYGSITMALGATARDSAAAQNLVRPMFVMLLVAFFVVLAGGGSEAMAWLIYLPPFTPFLLLAKSSDAVAPLSQLILLGIMLISALGIGFLAARLLCVAPSTLHIPRRRPTTAQPVV